LFTQKYQYSNNLYVGAKLLINNNIATITDINSGIITLDTNILLADTITMIQNPFLTFVTGTTVKLGYESIDSNLPVSFIFNGNINSTNSNNNITLTPSQIPPFQYTGCNKSFYGDVEATPTVFPNANASPGIFIRKTESLIANNPLSGNIGNINPDQINVQQKTAIMYKLYVKYE